MSSSRRRFLGQAASTALALGADSWLARMAAAQASKTARVILDPVRRVAALDRRVLGSFLEHLGRAIYGGIYDPGSKLADGDGFRKDVLAEGRKLRVPVVRYPGRHF